MKENEGKESGLLVERYKYLDLYPCSVQELRCLGYKVFVLLLYIIVLLLNRMIIDMGFNLVTLMLRMLKFRDSNINQF